ncbi:MAG: N-(5'-phosphoribosyl)anthranilate isomerase [Aureispira sp.]
MKIKASSIQNLTDARYFAAWHVEWLGFSLELGHANYTRPQDVKEIKEWLVGPKIVGEFGLAQSLGEIQNAVTMLNLDAVQLGQYADEDLLQGLTEIPVLQEWVLSNWEALPDFEAHCKKTTEWVDYYSLNLEKSGLSWTTLQEQPNTLQQLQALCEEYPILLSLRCSPEELEAVIQHIQPYGLSFEGGEEERVGVKSFDDLDALFETLEELDLIDY